MSQKSFYDLLEPGMTIGTGSHTFEKDEIVEFAEQFDPQAFHLSEEGAAKSHFGRLCASGWHTLSAWMRLNVENGFGQWTRVAGYDGPPPVIGPSPGIRNLRWTYPVYVGDTITYKSTIVEKRISAKREGWSIVTIRTEGYNQDGKMVVSVDSGMNLKVE